jgi:dTDP-4-dehydrorhamnose reductase
VLLTGASGVLGGRIALRLAERCTVIAARHSTAPAGGVSVDLDLASPASVARAFREALPDAVVHSAALADVDACERDPERAFRVNVGGTEAIARAAAERGLHLVTLSTDTVFPGDGGLQGEDATPRPLQVYGRTKVAAEAAALGLCPGAAVARVCLVTGRGHGPRGTASESIAWALRDGRPLRLFTDQYRTPVDADSVAEALALLLERRGHGIYHLAGPERVSRHALGLRVAALLGLPAAGLEPVRYADQPSAGPRPADLGLDASRARDELGWTPRSLEAAIRLGRAAPDIIAPRS